LPENHQLRTIINESIQAELASLPVSKPVEKKAKMENSLLSSLSFFSESEEKPDLERYLLAQTWEIQDFVNFNVLHKPRSHREESSC